MTPSADAKPDVRELITFDVYRWNKHTITVIAHDGESGYRLCGPEITGANISHECSFRINSNDILNAYPALRRHIEQMEAENERLRNLVDRAYNMLAMSGCPSGAANEMNPVTEWMAAAVKVAQEKKI